MRKIKFINHMVLCVAAIVTTSCGDLLDLAPIDFWGSEVVALQGWCKCRWTDYFQRCNYFTEFIQRDSWS